MKKFMVKELAQLIKKYEQGSSSFYSGASAALRCFLESYGYTCSFQCSKLVVHDWQGLEIVRV